MPLETKLEAEERNLSVCQSSLKIKISVICSLEANTLIVSEYTFLASLSRECARPTGRKMGRESWYVN